MKYPTRTCPQCGEPFEPHHHRQEFCTPAHASAFHDIDKVRGKVMTALVQTWRANRHKRGDGLGKYAFAEMCALADAYNAEDRKTGRKPHLAVARKRARGWSAADLG